MMLSPSTKVDNNEEANWLDSVPWTCKTNTTLLDGTKPAPMTLQGASQCSLVAQLRFMDVKK